MYISPKWRACSKATTCQTLRLLESEVNSDVNVGGGNYNFDPLLRLGVHSGRGFLLATAVFSTLLKRTLKNLKNNKQTNKYLSPPRPLPPPPPPPPPSEKKNRKKKGKLWKLKKKWGFYCGVA